MSKVSYLLDTGASYGERAPRLFENEPKMDGRGNVLKDIVREHYRYTYDHAGRALNTYYQLNNDGEICLSAFSYDSIGRLVQNLLYNEQDTIRYSFDIRNMLTETQNKHFSERLYYADYSSEDVTPCYNGNISAAHTAWTDTTNTFGYAYDAQNRLLSAKRLTDYSSIKSEVFSYDGAGNISTLKRYNGNRLIDNLDFEYSNDGNQLLKITDQGQDADLYSAIEYHNAETQADTTMFYDANGNLIRDLDRGITAIRYNILNLPDTILFDNGNRIVNLYDAAGHKYKSIIYTYPTTAVTSSYDLAHAAFDLDGEEYRITEYNGTIETCYTPRDTTRRIFNTIGYWTDSTYFYTLKDHLGNICAVVDASADTVVQRTMYYASGVPMAQSWGRDSQPYLYNGKEFVEAHGWNTYDYGFRGYYAPIGRFTSIDPLAEKTPWQSPYTYANNNFINSIDWMGLSGLTSMANGNVPHYIVIDLDGNMLGGVDDGDNSIYLDWDGEWEEKDGHKGHTKVGSYIWGHSHSWYMSRWSSAKSRGDNFRAPGLYDGQWSISFSLSIGLNFQQQYNFFDKNLSIGFDLLSFELSKLTILYKENEFYELSYIGENNRIKVTQGFSIGISYFERLFNIYASDFEYVPNSTQNTIGFLFNKDGVGCASPNGGINLVYGYGSIVNITITVLGNLYYQH